MCQAPHHVHHGVGVSTADHLAGEGAATAAHHIEQDAIAGTIAVGLRLTGPEERALAPAAVLVVLGTCPLGRAYVLGIEAYEVDAHGNGFLLKQAAQLEQDGHAAGAVIGGRHGFLPVALQGVAVGPGAGIPVGTEQQTVGVSCVQAGDDVGGRILRAVVERGFEALRPHLGTVLLEGGLDVFGTAFGSLTRRNARSEIALPHDVIHGAVSIKARTGSQGDGVGRAGRAGCAPATGSQPHQQAGTQHIYQSIYHIIFLYIVNCTKKCGILSRFRRSVIRTPAALHQTFGGTPPTR